MYTAVNVAFNSYKFGFRFDDSLHLHFVIMNNPISGSLPNGNVDELFDTVSPSPGSCDDFLPSRSTSTDIHPRIKTANALKRNSSR